MCWSDDLDWSEEQTDNPLYADDRNFYKLEKSTKTTGRFQFGKNDDVENASCTGSPGPALELCVKP